jgi:hypothetical protein
MFQEVEAPRTSIDNRHWSPYPPPPPPGKIPGTHFYYGWVDLQGNSAAGRIKRMNNLKYSIGNRTRDLPSCRALPQPTAPPLPLGYIVISLWKLVLILHHLEFFSVTFIAHKFEVSIRRNTFRIVDLQNKISYKNFRYIHNYFSYLSSYTKG